MIGRRPATQLRASWQGEYLPILRQLYQRLAEVEHDLDLVRRQAIPDRRKLTLLRELRADQTRLQGEIARRQHR